MFAYPAKDLARWCSFVSQARAGFTRLQVENDKLSISCTSRDFSVQVTLSVQGELPVTVVPQELFLSVIEANKARPEITLERDGDLLVMKAGRSKARFNVVEPSLYPAPDFSNFLRLPAVTVDAEKLKEATQLVSIFVALASKERPGLESVLFDNHDGKLRLVACDGQGLAFKNLDSECSSSALLPWFGVSELRKRLMGEATLVLTKNGVYAACTPPGGVVQMIGPTIVSPYPNYQSLVPTSFAHEAVFNTSELKAAITRMVAFAPDKESTTLVCSFEKEMTKFTLAGTDTGDTEDELVTHGGSPMIIGFTPKRFAASIRCMKGDTTTIHYNAPQQVVQFSDGDDTYFHYLMPVALSRRNLGNDLERA